MPKAQAKHRVSEVIAFGEQLIETEDLDPVYCALVRAGLPQKQLYRLLLAYFCYYHLGTSAYISEYEGDEFWDVMGQAAENQMPPSGTDSQLVFNSWPRGSERRHFRGSKCVDAVLALRKFSEGKTESGVGPAPEHIIGLWYEIAQLVTFQGFMRTVQILPMFGDWIAFKAADTMERVLGAEIEFPNDILTFYKEPRAALDLLDIPAEEANAKLLKHFAKFKAPPRYERPCNIQEAETVACKFKSYTNGHYWIGKDVHEIRKGLLGWGETATKLLSVMPKEVERGLFV